MSFGKETYNFIKDMGLGQLQHMWASINTNHVAHNVPLCKFIREHLFTDFQIEELESILCADKKEQLVVEQHWMYKLKPTLNKKRAFLNHSYDREKRQNLEYREKRKAQTGSNQPNHHCDATDQQYCQFNSL